MPKDLSDRGAVFQSRLRKACLFQAQKKGMRRAGWLAAGKRHMAMNRVRVLVGAVLAGAYQPNRHGLC